jgi:hypothetical protein
MIKKEIDEKLLIGVSTDHIFDDEDSSPNKIPINKHIYIIYYGHLKHHH